MRLGGDLDRGASAGSLVIGGSVGVTTQRRGLDDGIGALDNAVEQLAAPQPHVMQMAAHGTMAGVPAVMRQPLLLVQCAESRTLRRRSDEAAHLSTRLPRDLCGYNTQAACGIDATWANDAPSGDIWVSEVRSKRSGGGEASSRTVSAVLSPSNTQMSVAERPRVSVASIRAPCCRRVRSTFDSGSPLIG